MTKTPFVLKRQETPQHIHILQYCPHSLRHIIHILQWQPIVYNLES